VRDHPIVQLLLREPDPYIRAGQVLVQIQAANDLIDELNNVRAEAIYEVYKIQGPTRTAKLFGRSRSNIHRLIKPIQARDPEWIAAQQRKAEDFKALMAQANRRIEGIDRHRLTLDDLTKGGEDK
jgi:hypothetical protein